MKTRGHHAIGVAVDVNIVHHAREEGDIDRTFQCLDLDKLNKILGAILAWFKHMMSMPYFDAVAHFIGKRLHSLIK